ncbi:hypothetical protein EDB85DRAFT_1901137 [Lactarius pseudohatsudake]|nr:hypothetical protein EDB85DRAFT_1901137 [Lactarius pseudohatsudake]
MSLALLASRQGWRSRGVARGVVVTSCWRGDGVAQLTVGGLGRDVGGNERKKTKQRKKRKKTKTKKTALNEVISRAGGVGGNVGLVGSELAWWWTLRIALRGYWWWKLMETGATSLWQGGKAAVAVTWSAELVVVLHIVTAWRRGGAFAQRGTSGGGGGDVVYEKRHEDKKEHLPISSSSAGVLGGFARRGDGGELEATAGGMGRCVAWRRW